MDSHASLRALFLFSIAMLLSGCNAIMPATGSPTAVSESWKQYANSEFGLRVQYPNGWFGPEEHVSDFPAYQEGAQIPLNHGIILTVGSDKVYPWGTSLEEQVYTKRNSYYVEVTYMSNPGAWTWMDYAHQGYSFWDAFILTQGKQDGTTIVKGRDSITRIHSWAIGSFQGVEFLLTLSPNAQAEKYYQRITVLNDGKMRLLTMIGTPINPDPLNTSDWRDDFRAVDEANAAIYHYMLESITIQ